MFTNSKPKIGYLLKTYPKLSETFILNEILELEKQGMDIHIFSLRRHSDEKFHPNVAKVRANVTYIPSILPQPTDNDTLSLSKARSELIRQDGERYLRMLRFHHDRSEEKEQNEFLQACYLVRELQELGIAHLHAHFANVPTAVAELAHQFCGISYSITAHAKDIYLSKQKALDRRIKKAEFVLTCTEYNQKFLQGISTSPTPIYLSYHGLELARFQPRTDKQTNDVPLILSVGRFCEKKGFPYLLQACQLLKQKGHQFRSCIVGYGPMQADIEQMIQALQLGDVVTLPGKMTQDELIELYRKADIFALPCQITDDGDRDGIPNVLLEAMAMKVPVISTNISGIAELVEHMKNGILIPEKDPQSLAAELEHLMTQPQLMRQMGHVGREKVCQQFSLERNIEQIKDLFVDTLRSVSVEPQREGAAKAEVAVR